MNFKKLLSNITPILVGSVIAIILISIDKTYNTNTLHIYMLIGAIFLLLITINTFMIKKIRRIINEKINISNNCIDNYNYV